MITPKNIKQYIEGNLKLLGDKLDILPKHVKEQVFWRSQLCSDCMEAGQCKYCGCEVPGKLYVTKSCNDGEIFPDIMDKEDWLEYKIENNIDIDLKPVEKSYEINISGIGTEAYIFELNDSQSQILNYFDLENSHISELLPEIGYEDLGSYDIKESGILENNFSITVYDSQKTPIYFANSWDIDFEKEEVDLKLGFSIMPKYLSNQNHLIYKNHIQGDLFKVELVTDGIFDINKLKLQILKLGSEKNIICLNYDDKYLNVDFEYVDYVSIGSTIEKVTYY